MQCLVYIIAIAGFLALAKTENFITDREASDENEFSFVVEILKDGQYECVGALYNSRIIITAKACARWAPKRMSVRLGDEAAAVLSVEHNPTENIAILSLERPFLPTSSTKFVNGIMGFTPDTGASVTAVTRSEVDGQGSTALEATPMLTLEDTTCAQMQPTALSICVTFSEESANLCQHNKGSILVIKGDNNRWKLLGIGSGAHTRCSEDPNYATFAGIPMRSWLRRQLTIWRPVMEYKGCLQDRVDQREFPKSIDMRGHNVPIVCGRWCTQEDFTYIGLQASTMCFCGNSFGAYGSSDHCVNHACPNPYYAHENCGGSSSNDVYEVVDESLLRIEGDDVEELNKRLTAGGDPAKAGQDHMIPLLVYCEELGSVSRPLMIQRLAGVSNVNSQDFYGYTALHQIVRSIRHLSPNEPELEEGIIEALHILLRAGSDPSMGSNTGKTPRDLSVRFREWERAEHVVSMLMRVEAILEGASTLYPMERLLSQL